MMKADLPIAEDLSETIQRLKLGNEVFLPPDRLVQFEHWAGHIPFAFWLMRALRPRALVELGVHRGNSYCAFCQAISTFRIDARAFGIDTWGGDVHMGPEEGLLADLRAHHDPRYAAFSTLLEMTFDQARSRFADGSIDLLHIDGAHTYEAVRHDFEAWLPALSDRSVVLFHDIEVRRDLFGVWRFWEEVSARFPAFAFRHSHGLGVLATGRNLPPAVAALFDHVQEMPFADQVRRIFASCGRSLTLQLQSEALRQELAASRAASGPQPLEPALAAPSGPELVASVPREHAPSDAAHPGTAGQDPPDASAETEAEGAIIATECVSLTETDPAKPPENDVPAESPNGNGQRDQAAPLDGDDEYEALREQAHRAAERVQQAEAALVQAQGRAAVAQAELDALRDSTYWRIGRPLRATLQRVPAGLRRIVRRSLRLAWWTVTLQLPRRLSEYRDARRRPLLPPPAPTIAEPQRAAPPDHPVRRPRPGSRPRASEPAAPLPDLFFLKTSEQSGRIAVLVHLRGDDSAEDFRPAIDAISEPYDLIVSVPRGDEPLKASVEAAFPQATVLAFEERGGDILPLVALAAADVLFRYDLVCKLRAPRTGRALPLQQRAGVETLLAAFAADPDLGIVLGERSNGIATASLGREAHRRVAALGEKIGLSRQQLWHGTAGSDLVWMRPFPLRMVASLGLDPSAFALTADGAVCPTAEAVEWLLDAICRDAGMRVAEIPELAPRPTLPAAPQPAPKLHFAAYYLPQFHPTPANDRWWGRGFTEWTNVTRAKPLFAGHRQPRLPGELGFYDLRLAEVQEAQAALARWGGVSAFCYYYYWFDGRRELDLPLRNMMASGRPDLPFFLCWANEPWGRNWDGLSRNVLIAQSYAPGWIDAFAQDVAPALRDPRYFRLMGRPVLMIYRAMHIPGTQKALRALREALALHGVADVHLSAAWVHFGGDSELPRDPAALGLDSYSAFPPHQTHATDIVGRVRTLTPGFSGMIRDYDSVVSMALDELKMPVEGLRNRGVMAGWDNTARRGDTALIYHGATPAKLRRWLRGLVRHELATPGPGERLMMINAWNEWAEGTYLEPDRDFGRGWLEAVRSARDSES
jgi:lipopolysaccharide biosynthesis protein